MNKFKWPLNDLQMTLGDRLKIAKFFLNPKNRWTQGEEVRKFERKMASFVGSKYAVYVSSGSTANTLLAMYVKDKTPKRVVILPAVTWQTSCSPWIREGFEPHFIDVSLSDFSMDLDQLEDYLKVNAEKVACVFITSLLGFTPNIERLKEIEAKYNVRVMLDNCENTLGEFLDAETDEYKNVSSFFTSTTSTYFGHQLQSIEGGFIFTNSEDEYIYFVMGRNHGMTRSLNDLTFPILNPISHLFNREVDSRFDFNFLGNNFRNTDVNAFIGLLDLKRVDYYKEERVRLYEEFVDNIDLDKYLFPDNNYKRVHVPFCLPVICQNDSSVLRKKIALQHCEIKGIETRPIISGNLLKQTPYKRFGKITDFPNAEYLHNNGFYVGLYAGVGETKVRKLGRSLSKI